MNKKIKYVGFTLVEVLLFTAISGLVLVLLLSVLMGFFKSRNRAKKLSALQDTATYVFNDLTQELHWSDKADIASPGSLTVIKIEEDESETEITYQVQENAEGFGRLTKNSQPISLAEVDVNAFKIVNRADPDTLPLLEVRLELQYPDPDITILSEHYTTISFRKKDYGSL